MAAVLDREPDGRLIRKAGVMGIVLASGDIRPGDRITVEAVSAVGGQLEPV
jgi:MOSC domain-containing protein YiiM